MGKTCCAGKWLAALSLGWLFLPVGATGAQGGQALPGGSNMLVQTASGGAVYVVDAAGETRYLVDGIDPVLSPDGRQVAFTRWSSAQNGALGGLWVIGVDGSGERLVVDGLAQPKAPVWSPDGGRILLAVQGGGRLQPEHKCSSEWPSEPLIADEDGDYVRDVVDVEDGNVEVKYCYTLLPHPFWGLRTVEVGSGAVESVPFDRFSYSPAWDPANDWHAVYDGEGGLVNLDLNLGTTWAMTDDVNDHGPAFSPDGNWIVVSYWQHDHWEIHRLNADGSGRVRLTDTPLTVLVEQRLAGQPGKAWNNVSPTWSPDGMHIAFLSDRSGQWEVWVMGADGGDQHLLLEPGSALPALVYAGVDERALSWR